MAFPQPSLTPGWVAGEEADGWHFDAGLRGASGPGETTAVVRRSIRAWLRRQGAPAAADAVGHARSLGPRAGSPIYFNMETYARRDCNLSLAGVPVRLDREAARGRIPGRRLKQSVLWDQGRSRAIRDQVTYAAEIGATTNECINTTVERTSPTAG